VLRADARSLDDADRVAAEARERLGGLDVLFLNAGITRPGPVAGTRRVPVSRG